MVPEVMFALTAKQFRQEAAMLYGYACYSLRDRIYPGLIAEKNKQASGVLYYDLDQESIDILDWFEDKLYIKQLVSVRTPDNKTFPAYAYKIADKYQQLVLERVWDFSLFQQQHLQHYLKRCYQIRTAWLRRSN